MKVYFVRHGESMGNKKGLFQPVDVPLSQTGLIQAKIDKIYSSTHERARQTAGIISATLKTPIEYWDELKEIRNPSEIIGKSIRDPKTAQIKDLLNKNFERGNWKYSDEETFEELNIRIEKVVNHLLQGRKDQNVVCVSHGTAIKAIIFKMVFGEELTPKLFSRIRFHFWSTNTGISVCEYHKGRGWGVISWNDSSHL
jgi:probable phosphoglycerate mutase